MEAVFLIGYFFEELFVHYFCLHYNGIASPSRVNGVGVFPISKDILIFVFDFSSFHMI